MSEETQLIKTPRNGAGDIYDVSINTDAWIAAILGAPLDLEPDPRDVDERDPRTGWDHDPALLAAIRKHANDPDITMIERENTGNHESDLSDDFVYTVYGKDDGSEWYYRSDVYIVVTEHLGGDIRGNYGSTSVYRPKRSVGERGFFEREFGWFIVDISTDDPIDGANEQCARGNSSNPTAQLDRLLDCDPDPRFEGAWFCGSYLGFIDGVFVSCTPELHLDI